MDEAQDETVEMDKEGNQKVGTVEENTASKKSSTFFENLEEFVENELGLGLDMGLMAERNVELKANGEIGYGMGKCHSPT